MSENKTPDDESVQHDTDGQVADSVAADALPKIVSFDTLSRCGDEIWIENNGQIYRLRRTRQGKLILTK